MIEHQGVYKTTVKEYHTDALMPVPTLSATAVKHLATLSRLHCWQYHPRFGGADVGRIHKRHMEKGSALHSMVLGSGEKIRKLDFDNYKKKEAQEARDEAAANWEIPVLTSNYEVLESAARAIRVQLDKHNDAREAFRGGHPEMTLIWEEGGVWCRARLDYLADRREFDDFKGTEGSAEPGRWSRTQIFNMNYHLQAAFYIRGIKALGLHKAPIFRFIVAEMFRPYAVSVVACTETLIAHADQYVENAIDDWRECLHTNRWHGYANGNWWADVPSYLLADAEERRLRMEDEG